MQHRLVLILICLLGCVNTQAQFTAVVNGVAGYNLDKDFDAFREKYNAVPVPAIKKELGGMHLYKGVNVEINYRVLAFVGSLSRTYMHTGNKVVFENNATRYFDQRQQFTNVLFGFGVDLGKRSEMRFEIGIAHSLSDLYSFVKLPTGEMDYSAGGVSIQSTHVAIAYTGRISYYQGITDKWSLHAAAQYMSAKANNLDIDPHIKYQDLTVTHTYTGPIFHFGIAYKLTERDE